MPQLKEHWIWGQRVQVQIRTLPRRMATLGKLFSMSFRLLIVTGDHTSHPWAVVMWMSTGKVLWHTRKAKRAAVATDIYLHGKCPFLRSQATRTDFFKKREFSLAFEMKPLKLFLEYFEFKYYRIVKDTYQSVFLIILHYFRWKWHKVSHLKVNDSRHSVHSRYCATNSIKLQNELITTKEPHTH